jgi:hypothetical protein
MAWDKLNTTKQPKQVSIDGYIRSPQLEKSINESFANVFSTKAGEQVLKYLTSITQDMIAGPNMESNALWHLEGQRFLVGIIKTRIGKGKINE